MSASFTSAFQYSLGRAYGREFQRSLPPTLGSFSFQARHNDTLQGLGIFGRDSPKGERQSGGPFFKRVFFIFEFKGLRDLL